MTTTTNISLLRSLALEGRVREKSIGDGKPAETTADASCPTFNQEMTSLRTPVATSSPKPETTPPPTQDTAPTSDSAPTTQKQDADYSAKEKTQNSDQTQEHNEESSESEQAVQTTEDTQEVASEEPTKDLIDPARAFFDLAAERTVHSETQDVIKEGTPQYVALTPVSSQDSAVSNLLASSADTVQRVIDPTQTTELKRYQYTQMDAEDREFEARMSDDEGPLAQTDSTTQQLETSKTSATVTPIMSANMANMKTGTATQQQHELSSDLTVGKVLSLTGRQNIRNLGTVVKLPSPQSFKAEVFEQFRIGMTQNLAENQREFIIQLNPRELGEISVNLRFEDQHLHAKITAGADAKAQLEQDPDALRNIVREAAGLSNMSFTFDLQQHDPQSQKEDGSFGTPSTETQTSVQPQTSWMATDRLLDQKV